MKLLHCVLVLCVGVGIARAGAGEFAHAAVAADHFLASKVGADVLRAGGNAVDAAVATALALGVVGPNSSGLGGGGFLLFYRQADRFRTAIDFRETAPAAASVDMFKGRPRAATDGGLAVAVPGEAAGLGLAHRLYGKLPWARVVEGARVLARDGFAITTAFHEYLKSYQVELEARPQLAREWLRADGSALAAGQWITRPGLAQTLRLLADQGPDAFYRGSLASAIVAAVRRAGGNLTLGDLAGYRPIIREPLVAEYAGLRILTMPPPSSGGIVIGEVLGILSARQDWPTADPVKYHHLLIEAMKHGFADRSRTMGDPAFVRVPVARLLSRSWVHSLANRIDATRAAPAATAGGQLPEDHGTSHVSILDTEGNAVAMTLTVNTDFGSGVVVPGWGIVMNNEMDDFTSAPGVPNYFGLVQGRANAIAPGKRPLSSMSPTIALAGGRVQLVVGASGGPRIITGTLETLLNVVNRRMDAAAAVAAPRVHHQWQPDKVRTEARLPQDVARGLQDRGHRLDVAPAGSCVQLIHARLDRLEAACDARKGGSPDGY